MRRIDSGTLGILYGFCIECKDSTGVFRVGLMDVSVNASPEPQIRAQNLYACSAV